MPTFPTPGPVSLSVELAAGAVEVTATDTTETAIELTPARSGDRDALALIEQAHVEHSGHSVTVHVPSGRRSGFLRRTPEIVARITVPSGSGLAAAVQSADVRARGRFATSRLDSASGDVAIERVDGDLQVSLASGDGRIGVVDGALRVKSASGDLTVETCSGDVSAQSASGDLRFGTIGGDIDVKSASGDVTIVVAGGSSSVRTASGDVAVDGVGAGRTEIVTASGDVRAGIVTGIAVWLDVTTVSGDVRSALEPKDTAPPGDANVATLELVVRTVSGDIAISSDRRPSRPATTPSTS